jgi:hypothetical protein
MGRAFDWARVKQNDTRRQVIRDQRGQRLHDVEYPPQPDDPPPVNWALERWRARMDQKVRTNSEIHACGTAPSAQAKPQPVPQSPYVSLLPVVIRFAGDCFDHEKSADTDLGAIMIKAFSRKAYDWSRPDRRQSRPQRGSPVPGYPSAPLTRREFLT